MDKKTIKAYDEQAKAISDLHKNLAPTRLYELAEIFFIKSSPSVDIGCGIGRDTNWLNQHDFPAVGFDGSEGMLKEARQSFPHLQFDYSMLPDLKEVPAKKFTNVFCSAVLMHLPKAELKPAILNLSRITLPAGIILISFRGPDGALTKEEPRLYVDYKIDEVSSVFKSLNIDLIFSERLIDQQRPSITWSNLIFRKN